MRESRDRARLKYLFMKEGWTRGEIPGRAAIAPRFHAAARSAEETVPERRLRDHVGVHPQRQPGLSYVGASVLRGRLTGEQLEAAADLADKYRQRRPARHRFAEPALHRCPEREGCASWCANLAQIGLHVEGSPFWRGAVACTGTEFCKLAITETKGFTRWLVDELEERVPQFDQQLRLHVTGCPNGCGQHWIADIGIEGKKIKHEGKLVDAYYFCLGGRWVSMRASRARWAIAALPRWFPKRSRACCVKYLLTSRSAKKICAHGSRATPTMSCAPIWPAKFSQPVERDLPTGRVPHARGRLRSTMSLLPIFLKLDGRPGLLVGAGNVALEKISSLLMTGIRLRVVAPRSKCGDSATCSRRASWNGFSACFRAGRPRRQLRCDRSHGRSRSECGRLSRRGRARNLLSTASTNPHTAISIFGSVVRRGDLQIAISTAGESPAVAQRLRREIDEQVPADLGPWLTNLGELRREVLATHPRRRRTQSSCCISWRNATFCDSPTCSHAPARARSPQMPRGKVFLVGAGPGDPDLLTVKALRLIQSADVILHDDLVPPAILDLRRARPRIVNVGKRCGHKKHHAGRDSCADD